MSSFSWDKDRSTQVRFPTVILVCTCGQALRKSDCKALTFTYLERQIPSYNIAEKHACSGAHRGTHHTPPLYLSLSLSWGWGGNPGRSL